MAYYMDTKEMSMEFTGSDFEALWIKTIAALLQGAGHIEGIIKIFTLAYFGLRYLSQNKQDNPSQMNHAHPSLPTQCMNIYIYYIYICYLCT